MYTFNKLSSLIIPDNLSLFKNERKLLRIEEERLLWATPTVVDAHFRILLLRKSTFVLTCKIYPIIFKCFIYLSILNFNITSFYLIKYFINQTTSNYHI